MLTVGFSELRANLASVTTRVVTDRVEVTVFKRNKPAFKIVPIPQEEPSFVDEAMNEVDHYESVFERLAK